MTGGGVPAPFVYWSEWEEGMKMKRVAKLLAGTCGAALALAAASAAGAQAAPKFTTSSTGELTGTQTSSQVLTISAGASENVTCKKAMMSGESESTEYTAQKFAVEYSECTANTAFGAIGATVSKAEYELAASGVTKVLNTITFHVGGIANCNITVGPQTPTGSVSYTNRSGKLEVTSALTGIVSTSTGLCPHGSTGTYTGSDLVERVGGGTIAWDPI